MDKNNDLKFIARHYRKGVFAVEPALRRIKGTKPVWWRRTRIAAACGLAAILTATASIFIYHEYVGPDSPDMPQLEETAVPRTEIVRVSDFEQAPLTQVVARIREVYGVEVTGLPADPDRYELSLHYEGSARDLVETINDILDTDMKVTE